VQRAVFGDEVDLSKYNPRRFNPGAVMKDAIFGADDEANSAEPAADQPVKPVSMAKEAPAAANGNRPRPRPKPGPGRNTAFDQDAT
jgi:hypothetical protein